MSHKNDTDNERVVDFKEVRSKKLEEKRRKTERIFFQQILGVYVVTADPTSGLRQIELVDVSENGCAFTVPFDEKNPWPKDLDQEVVIRLYFSQDTYLPVCFRVQNSAPCIIDGQKRTRVGCAVDTSVISYEAWEQFVKFLELYSIHAHKDNGKMSIFYL